MSEHNYHLAQINIGRLRAPLDDPGMADFVNNLAPINQLGHDAPGFVWQLLNEDGNSTTFHLFDDPEIVVNFTVWESIETLFEFTYKSQHVEFFRRRHEWFEKVEGLPSLTMWWIPAGHIPSLKEAEAKILHLRDHGPTVQAFTFKHRFAAT